MRKSGKTTMHKIKNDIIVGIVVTIAILTSIFGYFFIREIPIKARGLEVIIKFNNVTGLTPGDAVTVSGVKVGRVRDISLHSEYVAVKIWLNGKVPFPKDCRAAIRSIGMIGEKYIDLELGASTELLEKGDLIPGIYTDDLSDVGDSVSGLIMQATTILKKFNNTITEEAIHKIQSNTVATSNQANYITEKIADNLPNDLQKLRHMITTLDSLSTSLNKTWNNQKTNVEQTISATPKIIIKVDSLLASTRLILSNIENQHGTVGKIVMNDELYNKTFSTIEQVQALLEDIKQHPGRYINASLIDF